MALLICNIPIAIIALVVYLFSADAAGWLVWALALLTSIYFFVKSFTRYLALRKGESLPGGELILIAHAPFSSSVVMLVALLLLFLDFSNLHLLWIAPLSGLVFEFTTGARTANKLADWDRP